MFLCKFCRSHRPNDQETTATKNLCKTCHNKLSLYKHFKLSGTVPVDKLGLINEVEEQIRKNKLTDGFVPQFYSNVKTQNICEYCGQKFESQVKSARCPECHKKAHTYRTLLNKYYKDRRHSRRLIELEDFFTEMMEKGYRVPTTFLTKNTRRLEAIEDIASVDAQLRSNAQYKKMQITCPRCGKVFERIRKNNVRKKAPLCEDCRKARRKERLQ